MTPQGFVVDGMDALILGEAPCEAVIDGDAKSQAMPRLHPREGAARRDDGRSRRSPIRSTRLRPKGVREPGA